MTIPAKQPGGKKSVRSLEIKVKAKAKAKV